MKTLMKTLLLTLLGVFSASLLIAQEYKFNMREGTLRFVEVNKVTINGTSGSEVIIKAKSPKNFPERAQGLRPISGSGKVDNTGFGYAVEENEDGRSIYQVTRNGGHITVSVPSTVKLHITHSGNQGGTVEITDFSGEIEADTRYSGLKLNNITGPILANTIYGKIEGSLGTISNKDMSIVSVYGLVDIALPASTKADLKLKSSYGDIFTDFDIEFDEVNGMKSVRNRDFTGKINGGGTKLYLEAKYGNVYLRSK